MASISNVNAALPSESLSTLEASEQALGMSPTTMRHVQPASAPGLMALSSSLSTGSFSPAIGSILICK